jgi:hypothetical protein
MNRRRAGRRRLVSIIYSHNDIRHQYPLDEAGIHLTQMPPSLRRNRALSSRLFRQLYFQSQQQLQVPHFQQQPQVPYSQPQPQAQQPPSNSAHLAIFEPLMTDEIQWFDPTPFGDDVLGFQFMLESSLSLGNFPNNEVQMESLFLVENDF